MDKNARSAAIKKLLVPVYGRRNVSVCQGRGRTRNWVYVTVMIPAAELTDDGVRGKKRRQIWDDVEKRITEAKIELSGFYPDYVPGQKERVPCLLVAIEAIKS